VNDTPSAHNTAPRDQRSSPPTGSRLTAEQRRTLRRTVAQRYATGASIRAIAGEIGRSYGLVHRLLQEANVKRRSRRGRLDLERAVDPTPSTP
jgi:hypothetical protein